MGRIQLNDVVVRARTGEGDVVILQPTTLDLSEHRIALIGANGSGKSTLARLVNGLADPARARSSSTDSTCRSTVRRCGVSSPSPSPIPAAQLVMPTAAEDVALSLRRTHKDKTERRKAAVEVLRRFGLEELADRSVHTLSGGQRQLLALAGVLATDPSILVADEPTTLLDLANTQLIGDLLFGLEQQLLLVTHDLDLAVRCDRALVIDDARVVFDGDPEQAVAFYRRSLV